MKKARQSFFTPMGGEQQTFDLEVLAALDRERALIQRMFGAAGQLEAMRQIWSFTCVAGVIAHDAPDGLFTVSVDVPRSGHRVRMSRTVMHRGSPTSHREEFFNTALPDASFEEALGVAHAVLLELAKGKQL